MLFRSAGQESAGNVGDLGSIPGLERSPGEEKGYPLQYSGLENPRDGGAWWAAVYGIAKSRTQLSDFHFHYLSVGSQSRKEKPCYPSSPAAILTLTSSSRRLLPGPGSGLKLLSSGEPGSKQAQGPRGLDGSSQRFPHGARQPGSSRPGSKTPRVPRSPHGPQNPHPALRQQWATPPTPADILLFNPSSQASARGEATVSALL